MRAALLIACLLLAGSTPGVHAQTSSSSTPTQPSSSAFPSWTEEVPPVGMNVTEGNMTGPGFYMEEFAFENVTQPNMTEFMEVPALEDVKFEASCAALRFDGSVKDSCSLKGGCLEACLMGGLEVYDKVSGDEVPGEATFFVPTIIAPPGIAGCSCPPAMGTMAPGSANFVGNYGGLPISFGPRDDLLILTLEDCEYFLSVTESKDSDGDGSPDCLGASGVSKDTVTVADARAAATAITVGVAAPVVISVTASVTAALVGGITAAAGGAAASSAAGGALGPLIMQAQFLGIVGQVGGKNNLPGPVRALSEGLAWTNFHLIPVYGEPSSKRGGRRNGNNATQAQCDAVKSSETELLGTLSTLAVALASAFKTRFLLRLQQIFGKDHQTLKAAGGQGPGQVLGFSWSDVALEDTLFGAYELPVFQKSFQGLAESAAEAASSGCPDYEAGGWVVLVLQFIWIFTVAFLIYKAVAAGYMKFTWFPKSKDGKKAQTKPNAVTQPATPAPAVFSVAPVQNNFGALPMGAATFVHPMGPAFPMVQPVGIQGLPVYGMRFGNDDITPADYCEMGELAGETSVTVNGQNLGQDQVAKTMDFLGDIEGKSKGWYRRLMGRFVGKEKQWGEWQKTAPNDKTTSAYFGRLQDLVKEHQGKAYWYQVWIVVMLMVQVIFIKFITDPESNVQAVFWLRIVDTVLRLTVMPQIDKEAYFEDAWAQFSNLVQLGSIQQYIQDKAGGRRAGADADGLSQIFLIFSCLGIAPQILFALREAYQKIMAIGDKIKELKDAVGKKVLMATGMDEEKAQEMLDKADNAAAAYAQAQAAAGKAAIVFNDPPKPVTPSTGPPPTPPKDALPVFPPMLFSMVDKNKDALAKEAEALTTQASANLSKAQADVNANFAKAQEAQKAFQNQMQSSLTFAKP